MADFGLKEWELCDEKERGGLEWLEITGGKYREQCEKT